MSPEALAHVLRPLQNLFDPTDYPDLLVGLANPDDAAVYRLDDQRALIITTDFFTPLVDDPYDYGAIAAANALSDVYAMAGRPLLALSIVAFPATLPFEVLSEVMQGMANVVYQAGAVVAGGHSIRDDEPKVGLCVVGMGHPDRLLTKSGAVDGDVLVLTKPLGSGIITTAAKVGQAAPAHLSEAVRCMKQLNWAAAEVAEAMRLRAATDITGFGLLGHAWEIAEASGVGLRFHLDAVPFLSGAKRYAAEGLFPGGAAANCATYGQHVRFNGPSEEERMLLYDPQTSGGLLVAVPPEKLDSFRVEMAARNEPCWVIGEVAGSEKVILVS